MPAQSQILDHVNSTFVVLALDTWYSGGCSITSFDVEYQVMTDTSWQTVESHIAPNTVRLANYYSLHISNAVFASIIQLVHQLRLINFVKQSNICNKSVSIRNTQLQLHVFGVECLVKSWVISDYFLYYFNFNFYFICVKYYFIVYQF